MMNAECMETKSVPFRSPVLTMEYENIFTDSFYHYEVNLTTFIENRGLNDWKQLFKIIKSSTRTNAASTIPEILSEYGSKWQYNDKKKKKLERICELAKKSKVIEEERNDTNV